ncbi:MAG: MarR family transcriptional regulator [Patescibacteria group bacterium]
MQRSQLVADIAEGLATFKRLLGPPQGHAPQKHLPTRAQIGILAILSYEGPQNLKDLAKRLCMSSSAATQLVNGLVKEKTLTRTEDTHDRRKIRLALTPVGKRKFAQAKKAHLESLSTLLTPLTDNELLQWKKLQDKILPRKHAV